MKIYSEYIYDHAPLTEENKWEVKNIVKDFCVQKHCRTRGGEADLQSKYHLRAWGMES